MRGEGVRPSAFRVPTLVGLLLSKGRTQLKLVLQTRYLGQSREAGLVDTQVTAVIMAFCAVAGKFRYSQ